MQYILVAEDDRDIQELIIYNLKLEGFRVKGISRGDQIIESVKNDRPALLFLDVMLPGKNGIEVCKALRMAEETRNLPIIMVTAKGSETDKVVGLELGADDYVTKPFSPKELVARAKAVLRRAANHGKIEVNGTGLLKVRDLQVDLKGHRVTLKSEEVFLTLTEFNLLKVLISETGKVMTRNDLMIKAIGSDVSVTDRTIDVHLAALRKKLGTYGDLIETVRGVGYRFKG
jgi:two-component system alkaline phosphatase synthesis response regulator PhoP